MVLMKIPPRNELGMKNGGSSAWWERTFFCAFPIFLLMIALPPLAERGWRGTQEKIPRP